MHGMGWRIAAQKFPEAVMKYPRAQQMRQPGEAQE